MQARPVYNRPVQWLAALMLVICTLLTPAATFGAPQPSAPSRAVNAPRAQQTFERWVDGFSGVDEDVDDYQPCTREPDPDDDTKYIYHSCRTISYALSVANPGDVIRVAGAPYIVYNESPVVYKDVTIKGSYAPGFGNVIEPIQYPGIYDTVINGALQLKGASIQPATPSFTPPPTEVRVDTLKVTGGGIDILSGAGSIPYFFASTINVTLENVTVYNVLDFGSGISLIGTKNKLSATKLVVDNNRGGTGGGIYAGSGTQLELGAGSTIKNNQATSNGGGIGASNAATITVSGGVTITGNSATNGGGVYAANSLITLGSDTTIIGNNATNGGGIYATGAPKLQNLTVQQNTATNGGGVYLTSINGGELTGSDILSNTATSTGGGYYLSGSSTNATIGSLLVQGNRATGGTSHGGGGYLAGVTNSTVQSNDFKKNSANNNGGGLYVFNSAVSLQGNSYTDNDANSGGGLYVGQSDSTIISGNSFADNTANYGGGLCLISNNGTQVSGLDLIGNHANQQGGGFYASGNSSVTFGSATIQANTSDGMGAGLYALNSTLTFTGTAFLASNIATGNGGGGYLASGAILTFTTLDLQENEGNEGGGFYADGGRVIATSPSSFISNKANGGAGGALYLKGSGSTASALSSLFAQGNSAINGGAFYADGVNLTLGTVNLTSNATTSGNGGGAFIANSTVTFTDTATFLENDAGQHGGGIFASASTLTFNIGGEFTGNEAKAGNGGGVYLTGTSGNTAAFGISEFEENLAATNGGGIYANVAPVTLNATSIFDGNLALAGNGGGFYVTGSTLTLSGVTFQSNRAFVTGGGGFFSGGSLTVNADTFLDDNRAQTGNGGGLAIANATNVLVDDALFSNNIGNVDGGALHITNSPLTVQNGSTFNSNTASGGRGGAIFVSGSNTTLNTLTFSKNSANTGGGALHITTGILALQNSSFSENNGGTTTGTGGGAYLNATSATLASNSFSKNLANSGAGLYLADTPSANLSTLQFTENSSSGPGGGLYLNNSTAGLNALTVRANQASGEGGGIYALHSRVNVTNTLIVSNKIISVTTYGAGVYLSNTAFNATHATIANNAHQNLQGTAHGFYVGVPVAPSGSAPTQSSLTLINSIVSGQAVGVNLRDGNDATFDAVLWNNTGFNWTGAGTFTVTRSRRGDPRFVATASDDYHLRRDSAAFDKGVSTSVSTDLDSVARTQGLAPDLGAYEHRYSAGLYLTSSISPAFVRNGDQITIQLRVKNQSASAANAVILRATLPSQLPSPNIGSAPGANSASCQGIFCEIRWDSLAAGADALVEINVQTNGTALTTGLLTLLTNITLQTANFSTSDTAATATAYLYECRAELNGTTYNTVQGAVDAASSGQTIRISGVCGDVHTNGGPGQLLTLNKDVTLQGGWNSDFTTLDPVTYPTYLDSASFGRVVYINSNVAPVLENLTLRGGSASALGGGPGGKDAGGGVYISSGTPTFINVDIANNLSPDLGGGVYLASPSVVNFTGGSIRNNTSNERGGGLYVDESAPVLTGVNIAGNSARGGGGVYLYRSPAQFIDNAAVGSAPTCRIDANTSSILPNYALGPTVDGLPVLWLAPGGGGGIVLDESAAIIRGCAINGNTARVGGGAYIHNSAATVENSLFTNNTARQPAPTAVLIGPGGVRDGDGGGIALDNQDPSAITLRGLLLGNNVGVRGSGLLTRLAHGDTLTLPHFTINTNSGGNAIFALGESRLAFVNTIVAFNTGGAAIFAQGGSSGETASVTLDHTLFHPPSQTKSNSSNGGTVVSTTEFTGGPAFRDDGYHLKRISFAYGVGNNAYSFPDRDGNPRPVGSKVELGADEYATDVTVRYVAVGGAGGAPCTDYRTPCASLQVALDASSAGDFIKMAGGTYNGVRSDGGRIHHALIQKNVTIEGGYVPNLTVSNNAPIDVIYTTNDWESPHPDQTPTIIDVNDQGRVFFITGSVAPTLSTLTLRRGNALALGDGPTGLSGGAGGAVYVDGASPIFKNVIAESSSATFGSGFYLRNAGGSYTGLTVRQNGVNIPNARGGGFYIQGGQPTLQGMTIQANMAITGAGVFLDGSAATLIQNTIQSNGNATTLDGGGLFIAAGTASLITNTIATNQAQHGGGLWLQNSNATLRGNTISNNRAGTNPAPSGQSNGFGGGLYIVGGAPSIVANTISNNQAVHPALSYGGGVYVAQTAMTFSGNTLSTNQAHRGGGLYFAATTGIIVQGNTITGNLAQAPSEALRASGGGVYLATATISFTTNTLRQNSALHGAGLYVLGTGQSQITQNTLTNNSATKDGGGVYLDSSDAQLEANTLQGNVSTGGRGGGLFARSGQAVLRANTIITNQAALEGGGLYLSADGTTLQGGAVQGNIAGDGGGIYMDGPAPGAAQPAPWLNQVTISGNRASNHGGALFLRNSGAQITLNDLRANNAAVNGGGAYLEASTPAAFSGNVIRGNVAGAQGGGLFLTRQSMGRYQSNAIIDNVANQGGGIFVGGASPTFVHTTLARNGTGLVAAVQDDNTTTVVLSNTIVANNTAAGLQGQSETTITAYNTLWQNNGSNLFGAGNLTSNNDFSGNPNFQDDGYHINANSAAANKGLTGNVATGNDVDGEGRFQGDGPELGADELPAACAVIIAGSPNIVYPSLQQAIDLVSNDGELRVAGTCTGVQTRGGTPQLVYFDKNITIRGGYKIGAWDTSLPTTQPTVLDAQELGRVVRVNTNATVVLANLTVINGTAAGLGGGPGNADAGGNIYVNSAQLTLRGVDVVNGRATVGGGLYLLAPIASVATSNFRDNVATLAGGAIYLDTAPTSVQVASSYFSNNRAADGGAIYAAAGTPLIVGNTFFANQTVGSSGRGGGIYLATSNASLNRNRLEANRAGLGGAIYVSGGTPSTSNNMLIKNVGITNAGAIYSINAPLHLRHNTLVANSTVASGGFALLFATPTSSQVLTMTNNIVVDHSLVISVATGNQLSIRATLWNNNQTKWVGAATDTGNNLDQAPLFVNAATGNYRLLEASPAVDSGINVGVEDDIDGQSRPARQGFDIGADEYLRPSLNATLTALPSPVASGAQQTYILQVINNGDVNVTAHIRLTLPAQLTPADATVWEDIAIARGAIWEKTLIATVDADYTGTLNATMDVTSDEGATASASASSTAAAISGDILGFSGESFPNPAEPGSTVELSLRVVNNGGIPIAATIQVTLPTGLTTTGPLVFSPTIAGPDGIWSTRLRVDIAPDVATLDPSGGFNTLVTAIQVKSDQGTNNHFDLVTTLAHPAIEVSRTPSPRPAVAGQQLRYTLFLTNTGNVDLLTTISNTFPAQVALDDLTHGQPIQRTLEPGATYQQQMTTTVEAGYAGPLVGGVQINSTEGVSAEAQDQLSAVKQQLTPTATAKGGDWFDPDSWEPPIVPLPDAVVLIPQDVLLYSTRPLTMRGLINRGELELRATLGNSQAMTITSQLENYGEILGRDATNAGQAGLTLNLNSAILYNEGTICAGDGAPQGGAGGDLIIVAGSTTNKGIFCAGHGANVNNANAGVPGGPGGDVWLTFDPGLFTNPGQVLAGNGGNSHPNAAPPQPGGNGGNITIIASAAARLNNSDVRGGTGGSGESDGSVGEVIIGAPRIDHTDTRFSKGIVRLFDQSNTAYSFAAIGPELVTISPASGLAVFSIRIFNRGARTDTFVVSPLTTPSGWTVNNLPSTLTLRPFRSSLVFVVLAVPTDQVAAAQVAAAIDQNFSVVISSQQDAGNQVIVPLRVVSADEGYRTQLPFINR